MLRLLVAWVCEVLIFMDMMYVVASALEALW